MVHHLLKCAIFLIALINVVFDGTFVTWKEYSISMIKSSKQKGELYVGIFNKKENYDSSDYNDYWDPTG